MLVTYQLDSMGCLHIWEGSGKPRHASRGWLIGDRECDLFFQRQDDIEAMLEYLNDEDKDLLDRGWDVETSISEDYFYQD